jgi:hypothetical protein
LKKESPSHRVRINPSGIQTQKIFQTYGKKYRGSSDARIILGSARYQDIAERCPQAFQPFVEFLENL